MKRDTTSPAGVNDNEERIGFKYSDLFLIVSALKLLRNHETKEMKIKLEKGEDVMNELLRIDIMISIEEKFESIIQKIQIPENNYFFNYRNIAFIKLESD